MEIRKHKDLYNKEAYLKYNHLRNNESFPIYSIVNDDDCFFKNFEIIEYVYDGVFSERSNIFFKKKQDEFKLFIKNTILNNGKINYIFAIEHKPNISSKLRSYKGVIDKNKIQLNYIQKEFFLNNDLSIFSLIVIINEDNFDYLISNFLFDDSRSFIISTSKNCLQETVLDKINKTFEIKFSSVQINYLKIVNMFCETNDSIFRIGGDGGEEYWSFQEIKQKI